MRRFTVLAAGLLILSACDDFRPSPEKDAGSAAPASAFAYAATADLSGYYMPVDEVRVGKWRLSHIFVGQESDFEGWKAGARTGPFAPVMIEFEDETSATVQTEIGEAKAGQARVLPARYAVDDGKVRFEGRSAELGRVAFDGRLDAGALATARRNLGDDGVVLTGTLTAGGQTVRDVKLRWWMGD